MAECRWLLDRPVSNSGRLKGIIEELAALRGWPWRVELAANPDDVLAGPVAGAATVGAAVELPPQPKPQLPPHPDVIVVTADSAVLDCCPAWFNLAAETVCSHVPSAKIIDLGGVGGSLDGDSVDCYPTE